MYILPVSLNLFLTHILFFKFIIRHEHNTGNRKSVHNYGQSSGSTTLRRHLVTCHLAEWVTACDKENIIISGDGTFGEMIAEYRGEVRSKPIDHRTLYESPVFTKTAFVNTIVHLIVTEDLVSVIILSGALLIYLYIFPSRSISLSLYHCGKFF